MRQTTAATALFSVLALSGCLDVEEGIVDPPYDQDEITEIPAIEYQALVALYESTNGTGWANNVGWLQTNRPCSWYGVHCVGGTVYGLNFDENRLEGTIPNELGNLNELRELFLRHNELEGLVPITVAVVGGSLSPNYHCEFAPGNAGLYMPNTPEYRAADLDGDGYICRLGFTP